MSNSARRKIVELHKEVESLRAALSELVALKDMKDQLSLLLLREEGGIGIDYDRRKPLAWKRARELATPNADVTGLAPREDDK